MCWKNPDLIKSLLYTNLTQESIEDFISVCQIEVNFLHQLDFRIVKLSLDLSKLQ